MSRVEYAWIKLDSEFYLDAMMDRAGEYFDTMVNGCGLTWDDAAAMFVASGLAAEFERQNPVFVAGKSGGELAEWVLERMGRTPRGAMHELEGVREHWLGSMLAYFQAVSGYSYRQLFAALPGARLEELAVVYMPEATPETFSEVLMELMEETRFESRLKERRKAAGLSQQQLAERAAVSLRALQQYEQGAKNINHASAAALYRISLVLCCTIEDLLEPPVL